MDADHPAKGVPFARRSTRDYAEMWAFYLIWVAAFAHAWLRPARAWAEQSWAIAVGAVIAVLLNAITTGDAIWVAAARGQWGVAGMDLILLMSGAVAAFVALRLQNRAVVIPAPASAPMLSTVAAE